MWHQVVITEWLYLQNTEVGKIQRYDEKGGILGVLVFQKLKVWERWPKLE